MQRKITVYVDPTRSTTVATVPVSSLARPDRPDEELLSQAKERLVYSGRLTHDEVAKALFVLPPKG